MRINEYDFTSDVELKLLALLVRRPKDALSLIKPSYFKHPIHVDIARIAAEAYEGKDLKADRLTRTSLWAMVWTYLKKYKPFERGEMKKPYRREIHELFKSDLSDKKFLLDVARRFSKESDFRDALIEAEKDVNAQNYERAAKRLQEAHRKHSTPNHVAKLPFQHLHHFIDEDENFDPAQEYLVFPIIPKHGSVLLYGLPKELKSWTGIGFAMDAAAGTPRALGFFEVPRAIKTLYVQVEDTEHMTKTRMRTLYANQVGRTSKITGNLMVLPRCALNLMDPQSFDSFRREVEQFRPELIVLDVFRRLFRGNVADAKETTEFLEILDSLRDDYGCAIVLVHHAKKGETHEIQTRALGSVNLTAWADVLIYLTGKRQVGRASVSRLYIESKSGMLEDKQLVVRVDEDETPMVRVLDEEQCEIDSAIACVRENPGFNQQQLVGKSGFPEKKLRSLLKLAVDRGLLREKHGHGKTLLYRCEARLDLARA